MSRLPNVSPSLTGTSQRMKSLPYVNISSMDTFGKHVAIEPMNGDEIFRKLDDVSSSSTCIKKCIYKYTDKYKNLFTRILTDDSFSFDSHFESGNLHTALRLYTPQEANLSGVNLKVHTYDLYLHNDIYTNGNTQWFYFKVSNVKAGQQVKFNIKNFRKSDSLFKRGMKPLVFSKKLDSWSRSCYAVDYYLTEDSNNELFESVIMEMSNNTNKTKKKSKRNSTANKSSSSVYYTLTFSHNFQYDNDIVYFSYCYPYTYTDLQKYLYKIQTHKLRSQYMRRKLLCKTIAGNRCDELTITSKASTLEELTARSVIFFSSRVHPGETNSSFIMHGIINFLTSEDDEAKILRDKFIFKIVPMLNPDGVINGNYRTSLAGCDLNRRWRNPDKDKHPTVFYTKDLIKKIKKYFIIGLLVDLHGHSIKKGVFTYGCLADKKQVRGYYPQLQPGISTQPFTTSTTATTTATASQSTTSNSNSVPNSARSNNNSNNINIANISPNNSSKSVNSVCSSSSGRISHSNSAPNSVRDHTAASSAVSSQRSDRSPGNLSAGRDSARVGIASNALLTQSTKSTATAAVVAITECSSISSQIDQINFTNNKSNSSNKYSNTSNSNSQIECTDTSNHTTSKTSDSIENAIIASLNATTDFDGITSDDYVIGAFSDTSSSSSVAVPMPLVAVGVAAVGVVAGAGVEVVIPGSSSASISIDINRRNISKVFSTETSTASPIVNTATTSGTATATSGTATANGSKSDGFISTMSSQSTRNTLISPLHLHDYDKPITGDIDISEVLRWKVKLFPRLISDISNIFAYDNCTFSMQKSKVESLRMVSFLELGIDNAYTLEASLAGVKNNHFSALDLCIFGKDICRSLLILYPAVSVSNIPIITTATTNKNFQNDNDLMSFSGFSEEILEWRQYYNPKDYNTGMTSLADRILYEFQNVNVELFKDDSDDDSVAPPAAPKNRKSVVKQTDDNNNNNNSVPSADEILKMELLINAKTSETAVSTSNTARSSQLKLPNSISSGSLANSVNTQNTQKSSPLPSVAASSSSHDINKGRNNNYFFDFEPLKTVPKSVAVPVPIVSYSPLKSVTYKLDNDLNTNIDTTSRLSIIATYSQYSQQISNSSQSQPARNLPQQMPPSQPYPSSIIDTNEGRYIPGTRLTAAEIKPSRRPVRRITSDGVNAQRLFEFGADLNTNTTNTTTTSTSSSVAAGGGGGDKSIYPYPPKPNTRRPSIDSSSADGSTVHNNHRLTYQSSNRNSINNGVSSSNGQPKLLTNDISFSASSSLSTAAAAAAGAVASPSKDKSQSPSQSQSKSKLASRLYELCLEASAANISTDVLVDLTKVRADAIKNKFLSQKTQTTTNNNQS